MGRFLNQPSFAKASAGSFALISLWLASGVSQPKLEERRLAERVGFEPTRQFPTHTRSRRAP